MSPEDDRRGREARKERAKCHKLPAEMHTDGQCRVAFSAGRARSARCSAFSSIRELVSRAQ